MRVESTDEFLRTEHYATGPYAVLRALDDQNCRVIWPRRWYTRRGDQLALFDMPEGA